jgi:magnesium transporter
MTLRELYNDVLAVIAKRPKPEPILPKIPSVLDINRNNESFAASSIGADKTVYSQNDSDDQEEEADVVFTDEIAEKGEHKSGIGKKVKFSKKPPRVAMAPKANGNNVTYRERLGGYLHPRDMRRLVTPFSSSNAPEVMVRRHIILLNCDPLRAIVLRDRLLVLVPDGADSILETLAKRIGGGREQLEDSVFGETRSAELPKISSSHGVNKSSVMKRNVSSLSVQSDITVEETSRSDENGAGDEWDDLQGRNWIDLPFELQAVDAVLHTVSIMLAEDVERIQEGVYETVDGLFVKGRVAMGDSQQMILRGMKNDTQEMSSRVANFVRALNDALDEEEDLALMNLSRLITHPERFIQPVPEEVLNEESDEPELILEAYMQQALSTANQLDLLKGQITSADEHMAMQLDTVRNRLLFVNTLVSTMTLAVALAAMVGSFFGMNVSNPLEEEPSAFRAIVVSTSLACFIFLFVVLYAFWKAGTLPAR